MTLLFHVDESRDSAHHFHVGLLTDGRATTALETELDSIVEDAVDKGACSRSNAELHGVAGLPWQWHVEEAGHEGTHLGL